MVALLWLLALALRVTLHNTGCWLLAAGSLHDFPCALQEILGFVLAFLTAAERWLGTCRRTLMFYSPCQVYAQYASSWPTAMTSHSWIAAALLIFHSGSIAWPLLVAMASVDQVTSEGGG